MVDKEFKKFIFSIDAMNVISFILLLIFLIIAVKCVDRISQAIIKKFPSKRMHIFQWIPAFSFIIYFLGITIGVYLIFEPSQEMFIWFIGSTAIAIVFALKDVLASIISGVILLIDKPFQIGDRITFENVYGEIVSMGLRSIKLQTLDESVVTIPNSRFMNDIVSSSSAGQLEMMTTVDVYIPIDEDLYKLKGILERIASESPYRDKKKNTVIVIKEVLGMGGVVSVVMTAKCIVRDARKEKAFQTDFLIKVNQELKNQNIQPKFV